MKLSWFNTSEAHNQYQAYILYEQYEAMRDIRERERELEIVDQSQTTRYVSRFEPLLYVPAFTQKVSTMSTQGISTEDLVIQT